MTKQVMESLENEHMRSGTMGMCASLCPPLSLSCWAPSGCCLSEPPLPVPPLEAALICGAEGGGCYLQLHHPCPRTLSGCNRVVAVLDSSAPERGGFPLGNKEKAPQTPLPLP